MRVCVSFKNVFIICIDNKTQVLLWQWIFKTQVAVMCLQFQLSKSKSEMTFGLLSEIRKMNEAVNSVNVEFSRNLWVLDDNSMNEINWIVMCRLFEHFVVLWIILDLNRKEVYLNQFWYVSFWLLFFIRPVKTVLNSFVYWLLADWCYHSY